MSYLQHTRAVRLALSSGDELGRLFAKLGNSEHPRGAVLSAYRQARRAFKGASRISPLVVMETFASLRGEVTTAVTSALTEATAYSIAQAEKMLAIYGLGSPVLSSTDTTTALAVVLASVTMQENAVSWLILSGDVDIERIIGDGTRVGLLSPAPVNREAANVLAGAMGAVGMGGMLGALDRRGAKGDFLKQAIAAIDHKTTDCCLRAHGQAVPMDKPFRLTGTPRYADELEWVPFHWYCRSSVALVNVADVQDALTQEMREAGDAELIARAETGGRVEIWPSHARSGRGEQE